VQAISAGYGSRLFAIHCQRMPTRNFHVGDTVTIKSGPYAGLPGKVTAIFADPLGSGKDVIGVRVHVEQGEIIVSIPPTNLQRETG
jgi:transcription antitermination factor NusG